MTYLQAIKRTIQSPSRGSHSLTRKNSDNILCIVGHQIHGTSCFHEYCDCFCETLILHAFGIYVFDWVCPCFCNNQMWEQIHGDGSGQNTENQPFSSNQSFQPVGPNSVFQKELAAIKDNINFSFVVLRSDTYLEMNWSACIGLPLVVWNRIYPSDTFPVWSWCDS